MVSKTTISQFTNQGPNRDPSGDLWGYQVQQKTDNFLVNASSDVRFLLTTGPFDLANNGFRSITFVILSASSLSALQQLAQEVRGGAQPIPMTPQGSLTELEELAESLELRAIYPNPAFLGQAKGLGSLSVSQGVTFEVAISGGVEDDRRGTSEIVLEVYNLKGERMATVAKGAFTPGRHRFVWDGRNKSGEPVRSGLYSVVLKAGNRVIRRSFTLIR